jgi:galactokinase
VNLIGEHTDYNDGFVLPMAIDFATMVDATARDDRLLTIASDHYSDVVVALDLDALPQGPTGGWADCPRGMVLELQRDGAIFPGADLRIASAVPLGAGLSSSAALEIATGLAMLALAGARVDRIALAKVAQRAENEQMGTRSGIMDPYVCAKARSGEALLLDTRALTDRAVQFPHGVQILICNTMVQRKLASGQYNLRRESCERAVEILHRRFPAVAALREVTLEQLEAAREQLDPVDYRRCRHVITEDARTLETAEALSAGRLHDVGRAMNASHASLRDDYEVSCEQLDVMVELARSCDGVYGARMTGGGFGGCAIALVPRSAIAEVEATVRAGFARAFGVVPDLYRTSAAGGAEVLSE